MYPEKREMGVIVEPHRAEVHSEPVPPLGAEEVLVQMETCNICTTDYQQWMGLRNHQGFPMAGGHEWAGVVAQLGEAVTADLQIGDRVSLCSAGCGQCDSCRMGLTADCRSSQHPGLTNGYYGGRGFGTYVTMNQKRVMKVSNDVPPEEAGFLEPLATVVSGAKKIRIAQGENVVVVGAGTMGLLNAQVAGAFGANVIVTELSPKKLDRARAMGFARVVDAAAGDPVEAVKALTDGAGADVVIPAVGHTTAYAQAYAMLKQYRGRMLLFAAGYPAPELKLDANEIHYRKLEISGTVGANLSDFRDAARMIATGRVQCRYSLEGRTFALQDIQRAYELAATPDTYRVTVDLRRPE